MRISMGLLNKIKSPKNSSKEIETKKSNPKIQTSPKEKSKEKTIQEKKVQEVITSDDISVFEEVLTKREKQIAINTSLTVILVENSHSVFKQREKLMKIIKHINNFDFLCIINYGKETKVTEVKSAINSNPEEFLSMSGSESCFYDSLLKLKEVVESNLMKTIDEDEKKKIVIKNIDIIGIGRCFDNCSKISEDEAMKCFCSISKNENVTTKYFCLTDESFISAAKFGFHSIGAVSRDYIQRKG